jgi:hydroxypyruvate isomerase
MWQQSQANISILFGELPFERRPAGAAEAGFTVIECWWPFASATPRAEVVDLLTQGGYTGAVGLEYIPAGDTVAGLAWLQRLVPSFGQGNGATHTEVIR